MSSLPADRWLCPLSLDERADGYRSAVAKASPGPRASDKGLLPIGLDEYSELLDWTGRRVLGGKSGAIPASLAPILDRLHICPEEWLSVTTDFDRLFRHVVGRGELFAARARRAYRTLRRTITSLPAVYATTARRDGDISSVTPRGSSRMR